MAGQADNRAPYAKIAAHYSELIASGQLPPGSLLPSIKNLAEEWSVSTATAEKALRKLRNEGLVRGIHGIGTEVLDQPAPMSSGSQRQDRGRRTGSSWGSGERSDSHEAAVVPAPPEVAQALGIEPRSDVIRGPSDQFGAEFRWKNHERSQRQLRSERFPDGQRTRRFPAFCP